MYSFGNAICAKIFPKKMRMPERRIALTFFRNREGVTAIEFAITFPILLLIIFGTLEFGRALKARNEMSHALSKAVRVINLDADQTTSQIKELLTGYLSDYGSEELTINVTNSTLSGTDYMHISASFPFHTAIPFSSTSILNLNVETIAPVISPTK